MLLAVAGFVGLTVVLTDRMMMGILAGSAGTDDGSAELSLSSDHGGNGIVVYTTYDSMEVNQPKIVELRVTASFDSLPSVLFDVQRNDAQVKVDTVKVGTLMRAELSGVDFDIDRAGPLVQRLDSVRSTWWVWTVKPRSPGRKFLLLTLSAVTDEEGRELSRLLTVLRQRIEVIATETDTAEQANASRDTNQNGGGSGMNASLGVAASFAAALVLFLIIAYFHPPNSPFSYTILRILSALCGGLAGGLITGEAMIQLSGQTAGGGQYAISGAAGFALFIIIWFFFPRPPPEPAQSPPGQHAQPEESGYNFRPPIGSTFEEAINHIVESRKAVARMEGFTDSQCRTNLQSREIHARDATHALTLLRDLAPRGTLPAYDVAYNDSVYYLQVRGGA